MIADTPTLLRRIDEHGDALRGRDVLQTWDASLSDLQTILDVAEVLRRFRAEGSSARCFDSGLAISQFRDNSTRTRFSFASAANLLGLAVQDLDEGRSQIAHGETTRETAVMISFLSEVIGIRDDIYLGSGHAYMLEVAAALDAAVTDGVLGHRPTVVNLQSDRDHPTQTLADLHHLLHEFGSLEALQGRKIAMTWAHSPSYGKPLSVPQGVIGLMTRLGMDVTLAHPPGYELLPEITRLASRQARASGGRFRRVESLDEAFEDADVVYPKSWAPYRVMERRTDLLRAGDEAGLRDLEQECLVENARHVDWECDAARMARTRHGRGLYLHCLPADITGVSCERGEVSEEVFERYRTPLYRQAGYKPFVIAALILCGRFGEPATVLRSLREQRPTRVPGPTP